MSAEGGRQGSGQGRGEFSRTASRPKIPVPNRANGVQGGDGRGVAKPRKAEDRGRRRDADRPSSLPARAEARTSPMQQPVARTPRRLVSLADAAAYADVSIRTVRRYIAQGRLTGYRVGPRLVKVDLSELVALARPIPSAGDGCSGGRPVGGT